MDAYLTVCGSQYALAAILVPIVHVGGPCSVRISNNLVNLVGTLCLIEAHVGAQWSQSLAKLSDCLLCAPLEAWKI